jgi:hypothetical protein
VVRPTLTPIQARVLGAALGVTGFAFASFSGFAAMAAHAESSSDKKLDIEANSIWVSNTGHFGLPPNGRVPTLDCGDLSVWGYELNRSSGTYHVTSDDPSGHDEHVLTDQHWSYDKDGDRSQVVSTIDGKELIQKAEDHGDKAKDGRFRFDVFFDQGSHQHVYFWVRDNCEEGGGGGGGGGEGGQGSSSTPTPVHVTAAPPPAAVSAVPPKAVAAAVPQTGADAPFLTGMVLMSAGGASLGVSRRLRRRNAG